VLDPHLGASSSSGAMALAGAIPPPTSSKGSSGAWLHVVMPMATQYVKFAVYHHTVQRANEQLILM